MHSLFYILKFSQYLRSGKRGSHNLHPTFKNKLQNTMNQRTLNRKYSKRRIEPTVSSLIEKLYGELCYVLNIEHTNIHVTQVVLFVRQKTTTFLTNSFDLEPTIMSNQHFTRCSQIQAGAKVVGHISTAYKESKGGLIMCGKKGLGQCKGHASTFDAQGQREGYGYTIELQYYILVRVHLLFLPLPIFLLVTMLSPRQPCGPISKLPYCGT